MFVSINKNNVEGIMKLEDYNKANKLRTQIESLNSIKESFLNNRSITLGGKRLEVVKPILLKAIQEELTKLEQEFKKL